MLPFGSAGESNYKPVGFLLQAIHSKDCTHGIEGYFRLSSGLPVQLYFHRITGVEGGICDEIGTCCTDVLGDDIDRLRLSPE